jgi:hypothetical protein
MQKPAQSRVTSSSTSDRSHSRLVSSTRNSSREPPADCHQEEEANCAQNLQVDDACQHGKAGGQSSDEENKNPEPALRHQYQAADKSPRNFRAAATLKRKDSGAGSEGVGFARRALAEEREIAELDSA